MFDVLKEKLKKYKKEDIVFTDHAKIQALVRQIDIEEVRRNILNPEKLVYAKEKKAERAGEEKYDCYFAYSETLCHRYIFTINRKIIIVTLIRINRKWQSIIKK